MAKLIVALKDGQFPPGVCRVIMELFGTSCAHLFKGVFLKELEHRRTVALVDQAQDIIQQTVDVGFVETEMVEVEELFELDGKEQVLTATELARQSVFADLMILTYEAFMSSPDDEQGKEVLTELVKQSKCPVLLLPEKLQSLDHFILTFDGKESSVYAIKNFSLLFSASLKEQPVSIMTVIPSDEQEIKNERALLELVQQHFNDVGLQVLQGEDVAEEIIRFSRCTKSPLIVMGAFGRSSISNLLLPSVAGQLIEKQQLPLFIAHH